MDRKYILDIIQRHGKGKGGLIAILEEIQGKYAYLPEAALRQVAQETAYSLTDVYGAATFYKAFSLKPKGKHCVSACLGTACHVRGAQKIVEAFTQQLGVKAGDTTPDKEITFETVNCLGACALGPIVVADGHYHANVTAGKVKEIIRGTKEGSFGADESKEFAFSLEAFCPHCGRSLMDREHSLNGHPSILLQAAADGEKGWLRMSSLYGNFGRIYEHRVPEGTIASLACPHCCSTLPDGFGCVECGAPLAAMKINGGDGVLRVCTRAGCTGHLLELTETGF
jgi:NADH-quinone oxidoreductase subunit E